MPRKKKGRSTKPADEYTHLSLGIEDHRIRATAGISHHASNPQYAWRDTEDEPLYEFETHLELKAVCTDPSARAGETYTLTIYGEANPKSAIYSKLKDVQAVNEHRTPQYRTYRGRQIRSIRLRVEWQRWRSEEGQQNGAVRFGPNRDTLPIC